MLASLDGEREKLPVVQQAGEMEVGNLSRHAGYTQLAHEGSGEIVVDVDVLRSRLAQALDGDPSESPGAGGEYGQRMLFSDPSLERQTSVRQMLTEEVQHVASETWLITRLSLTLLRFLGIGTRWIGKFIRLFLYAMFLLPGFVQIGYYYFFSKDIQRSLVYGDHPRNRFDLYLPTAGQKSGQAQIGPEVGQNGRPAVIFITGGAWVIGYKAWGTLLARQLVERNIIVTCIDYRNFPQGCVSDMVADVSRGIGHVFQNIESWGGDPNKIYLVGQSAGAHLGACALLMQAKKQTLEERAELTWKASQLKAYFALSGGYNLMSLMEHFNRRGLYKKMFLRIMEGEESLPLYSPECIARSPSFRDAVPLLPPITLFHGTADYSIPHEASVEFAEALQSVGATVNTVLYPDKTHTDLFLQVCE
ncbi:hypothetical protein KC19_1G153200 [Ceratodon purpureus]|uniref:protein-S-isoprenylcysteine alpha-carbonyl methylesterase n=1 Tax=Ceratodon purpureus TaxID=3225 RepID=A0A8T0J7D8_CERPU|nr:hypothetical protein KC19_1G153200 [Ceratodon purpureus]